MHWCWEKKSARRFGTILLDVESKDGDARACTYRVSLHIAVDDFHRSRVHWDGTRAEDHAIGDDGLAVDTGQRLGGLISQDGGLGGGHVGCSVR